MLAEHPGGTVVKRTLFKASFDGNGLSGLAIVLAAPRLRPLVRRFLEDTHKNEGQAKQAGDSHHYCINGKVHRSNVKWTGGKNIVKILPSRKIPRWTTESVQVEIQVRSICKVPKTAASMAAKCICSCVSPLIDFHH